MNKICSFCGVRELLRAHLHRRGLVVAISGGVDSAVCAALAVRAVGRERVFGLLLPERDSASESSIRGRRLVEQLGIAHEEFDIAPVLDALGCYRWRDAAIRTTAMRHWPAIPVETVTGPNTKPPVERLDR